MRDEVARGGRKSTTQHDASYHTLSQTAVAPHSSVPSACECCAGLTSVGAFPARPADAAGGAHVDMAHQAACNNQAGHPNSIALGMAGSSMLISGTETTTCTFQPPLLPHTGPARKVCLQTESEVRLQSNVSTSLCGQSVSIPAATSEREQRSTSPDITAPPCCPLPESTCAGNSQAIAAFGCLEGSQVEGDTHGILAFRVRSCPGCVVIPGGLSTEQQQEFSLAALVQWPEAPAHTNHRPRFGQLHGLWHAAVRNLVLRRGSGHEREGGNTVGRDAQSGLESKAIDEVGTCAKLPSAWKQGCRASERHCDCYSVVKSDEVGGGGANAPGCAKAIGDAVLGIDNREQQCSLCQGSVCKCSTLNGHATEANCEECMAPATVGQYEGEAGEAMEPAMHEPGNAGGRVGEGPIAVGKAKEQGCGGRPWLALKTGYAANGGEFGSACWVGMEARHLDRRGDVRPGVVTARHMLQKLRWATLGPPYGVFSDVFWRQVTSRQPYYRTVKTATNDTVMSRSNGTQNMFLGQMNRFTIPFLTGTNCLDIRSTWRVFQAQRTVQYLRPCLLIFLKLMLKETLDSPKH
jgi:hypothetical protein